MAEYIDKNHFDERIRIAVGMCEGDVTSDFKDGVLFALNLLKSEENADVISIPEGATREQVFKEVFGIEMMMAGLKNMDWWKEPYRLEGRE